MSSDQYFPDTRATWIGAELRAGRLDEVNRHLMTVYRECLCLYLRRTPLRRLGDPDDLVQGFFANRLSRPDFLTRWTESEKRLRHWLMNAMKFYLRETLRKEQRGREVQVDEVIAIVDSSSDPEAEFDRAYRAAVVRDAGRRTAAECERRGQLDHFKIFLRHRKDGETYAEIAPDFGLTAEQAAVRARIAESRFAMYLRETLRRELPPHERVDQTIRDLLDD